MTTPPQLQPDRSPFAPRNGGEIGPRPKARPPRPGVLSRARSGGSDLWRSCHPACPVVPRLGEPRTASTTLASTRAAFPALERLPSTKCVAHFRRHRPPPIPSALPPRFGFRRSFAPPMLSHERARSSSIARALRPGSRGPRAACRLLQSKRSLSTAARSIEPRSPRSGSPLSPASSALDETAFAISPARRTGGRAPFEAQPAKRSRVRGRA